LNNSNNSNSPATLDPENSSPASIQSSTIHPLNQNHNSHQSFGFDTPSLWSTNQQSSNHLRISGNAHTAATKVDESTTLRRGMASPSRSATVEATTKRLHSKSKHATNEEHSWQDIAAAHIARIQQEQLHLHNDNDSQQCTLLTSHVNNPSDDATTPIRTTTTKITMDAPLIPDATARKALTSALQESTPPLVTSPDIKKKVRDSDVELVRLFNSFRFSPSTSCSHDHSKLSHRLSFPQSKTHIISKPAENKRKRVAPVKRPKHSIKESIPSTETDLYADVATSVPLSIPSPKHNNNSDDGRKRTRLNFDPVIAQPTSLITLPSSTRSPVRSRPTNAFSSKSNSPRRISHSNNNSKQGVERELVSSLSREPLTSNANCNKSTVTKALAAITNNAKISDFFALTKQKRSTVKATLIKDSTAPVEEGQDLNLVVDENVASTRPTNNVNTSNMPSLRSIQSLTTKSSADTQHHELALLKQRYDELQRTCQDKDEQLKAVSNNRTILHTALQAALRQRENELESLRSSTEEKDAKYRDALEELVRTDACQEAREIREKLAADGARLGRIMAVPAPTTRGPPRMLMQHRANLESWEDGYATKELQQKMKDLQAKKTVLEERQKEALLLEENFWKGEAKRKDAILEDDQVVGSFAARPEEGSLNSLENDTSTDGAVVSALDVREAVESVRYHLSLIRQQEKELALAEQALNDEKGAHIRALKRVASEDASRFRSRPKLHDRYVLRSLLGKGGFSEVWLAFDLLELREVAVKIHQLDSRWPDSKKENYTKHVSREYEIHRSVRHPRIVSLFDVFEIDNNSFATVLESCEGTDLDTLLKTKRRLPERDARSVLLQILCGMNYLSHPSEDGTRQGIIHYDLKPGNILFDRYGDAKITDFGLSKIVDTSDPAESMELTSQGAGTYWYLPPECFVLDENVRISNKVDVWSIGVIFYQMLFGKRPFGDGQSQDKMLTDGTMLNARTVTIPERPEVTLACKEFIEACLTYDQQFRPTIAQTCQHTYVLSSDVFK
jgi:tousled-like kinase